MLALKEIAKKSGGKTFIPSKVWKLEEASNEEVSDGDSDNEETTFIIRSKPGHFKVDCPGLQNDIPKKGSFYKDIFISRFKKSLMAIWDELDNEESSDKNEGEENLTLMALISSDTKYESTSDLESNEEDKVFSNLSRSNLISFIQDLMSRFQDNARDMKTLKM
ncbi:hypothetical protein KIW84_061497 [Lathyrus oleraceus]|uniref:Uncharacterized protein n=1 Tax=Pisum sativum TaxID=3888 RepID=A0A9D4W5Z3_PEA|nr:hypothetical protein KIW84_061497 [Pisum sativum]